MAEYRSVQTRMWREDEWFQELDVEARLFWIYLFTNPSASPAGIYRLPLKTMAFESGIDYETVSRLMEQFAEDGKAKHDNGVVWVVNMRRLQFPTLVDGSKEWQTGTRIQRDIDAIPDRCPIKHEYLMHSGYPIIVENIENGKAVKRVYMEYPDSIDTPSIPHTGGEDTPPINVTKQNETKHQPNGKSHADELIDPEVTEAIGKWQAVFAGTPFEAVPPVSRFHSWLAFGGIDVLLHMIEVAREKAERNPAGWLYTTYDNWRKDGEVAPYIAQQVESKRAASAPAVPIKIGIIWPDGTTGEVETTKRV